MSWFLLATISALSLCRRSGPAEEEPHDHRGASVRLRPVVPDHAPLRRCFSTGIDVLAVPPDVLLLLVGKSIIGGTAFLLVMMSLERGQISNVLPLLGLTPAVTALLSLVLTGETMRWTGVAGTWGDDGGVVSSGVDSRNEGGGASGGCVRWHCRTPRDPAGAPALRRSRPWRTSSS